MFVRVTSTPNSPRKSVRIVESVREGYKVKQIMLHHVGIGANEEEIEKLKQLGREFIATEEARKKRESAQLSLFDPLTAEEILAQKDRLEALKNSKKTGRKPKITLKDVTSDDLISLADLVEEKRTIEGVHDIAGHVYDDLGYNHLLSREKDQDLLKDLVLMRLTNPSSKLKAQSLLSNHFSKTHDMDSIYRMMDKLLPQISKMKQSTFEKTKSLIPGTVDVLFFDCTTLYFESVEVDELRKFGYSKDHRFSTTQVVLALATNSDGLPIGYELFEGNKAEVKTLLDCITVWKENFKIADVCFVADRAMMSDDNLEQLERLNYTYVIAAKLRALPRLLQEKILSEENYQIRLFGDQIGWVGEFTHKERRLIVSYKTKRAQRNHHQRQQIIDKITKRLGTTGDTQKLISNQGVKKYTQTTMDSKTELSQEKIQKDVLWDGFHGIMTNIKEPAKNEEEAKDGSKREDALVLLSRYGRLWKIEESFRLKKHTLSTRPIFHFKPERIKAHIAMCYMAFTVLRHMEYRVQLTQKISPQTMIDELMNVQSSFYRHTPTGRLYRMPGKFTNNAAKIYKAFQIKRCNHAQEIIQS